MTAPKRYTARAEAVRCAEEVLARKGAGQSLAAIYDDLIARGELSMGLRAFQKWMKRFEGGESFVPLSTEIQGASGRDYNAAPALTPLNQTIGSQTANPSPSPPSTFRHARLGVPAAPLPNLEPDLKALLGDDD